MGTRLLGEVSAHVIPLGLTRSQALTGSLAVAMLAGALSARSLLSRLKAEDCLALLAFLCLLRCALDPVPLDYNLVSVLVPLTLWELRGYDRAPLFAVLCTAAVAVVFGGTLRTSAPAINALVIATYLGIGDFSGSRARSICWRVLSRRRRRWSEGWWRPDVCVRNARRVRRTGDRVLLERRCLSAAEGRVACDSRLPLPEVQRAGKALRQRAGAGLADVARSLPAMRGAHCRALSLGRRD